MTVITYDDVLRELRAAIDRAPSHTEAMHQTVSILKDKMPDYSWVGIYLLDGEHLLLGPYLGKPSPHTRIPLNQGICGAAASQRERLRCEALGESELDRESGARRIGASDRRSDDHRSGTSRRL